jgi:ribosomal protein S12 methylthiotransferase accessory factor
MLRPTFQDHLHVEVVPPNAVYLLSERGHMTLTGRLFVLLAPLLDGQHTVEAIIGRLAGETTAAEIAYALARLEQKGYIRDADTGPVTEGTAFWTALGLDASKVRRQLERTRVSVTALGGIGVEPFAAALTALQLQMGDSGAFGVVLTDDYLQVGLAEYNQQALDLQRPWMLVKPVGTMVWIGPVFRPGKTACWECMAHRLSGNRDFEGFLQQRAGRISPFALSQATLPSSLQMALSLAATEAAKAIVLGENAPLQERVLTMDLLTLELRRHVVVQRPQCPRCGNPQHRSLQTPLILASVKKIFVTDGGHRTCAPEQTIERFSHHVSPITGVIRSLRRTSDPSDPVTHEYVCEYQGARPLVGLNDLEYFLRRRSGGKGKTDSQAHASALCEALEAYSGCYQGDEATIRARYAEVAPDALFPPYSLLFSEAQYRNRALSNVTASPLEWIPHPFDEERAIDWTPLWSLTEQREKYAATAQCYYGYPQPDGYQFCQADSNGCAAGNTKEEAILQGLMELVERDSVALWWYNMLTRPAVDLASFAEPYLDSLLERYRHGGRDLWVLDITSDLEIPAFVAVSRRVAVAPEHVMFGFGAHLDPSIALLRAVTELNQLVAQLPRDFNTWRARTPLQRAMESWCTTATIADHPYLAPDASQPVRTRQRYLERRSEDLRDDILLVVDILERQGIETLVLDQTRPDVGLSVVRVITPGLRHFWARLAPGRLYDAPVRLGWLPASLPETSLNKVPMFL